MSLLVVIACGMCLVLVCVFFFFFQAEDGIRDVAVTGVQTCALPICERLGGVEEMMEKEERRRCW